MEIYCSECADHTYHEFKYVDPDTDLSNYKCSDCGATTDVDETE